MGAIFSAAAFGAGAGTGFSTGSLARSGLLAAGFAVTGLVADLLGFTVTFDVAIGFAFVGGRAAFLGAAGLAVAFLGVALPGRLAALLGFFEGI
jgi:hypothetical protein